MNTEQSSHLLRPTTAYAGRLDRDFGVGDSNAASDTISCLRWAPNTGGSRYRLASTSWDGKARVYDISNDGSCTLGAVFGTSDQPLFTCAWSKDATITATAGAGKSITLHDVAGRQNGHTFAAHDAPISGICMPETSSHQDPVLISASWDQTARVWDLRNTACALHVLRLPERATALVSSGPKVLIATADRFVHAVDLVRGAAAVQRSVQVPLDHRVTTLALAADQKTWAVGGIEGRVWVDSLSLVDERFRQFCFKAHRDPRDANGEVKVWTVNDAAFNPRDSDVLSTAGSDGTFVFWNIASRSRLCFFPALPGAITATSFSPDGRLFAYAVGYDWSRGFSHNHPEYPTKLMLHPVSEEELSRRL